MKNTVVIRDAERGGWLHFSNPNHIITTDRIEDVTRCLVEIERQTDSGMYAAGFISYEAASAFDDALTTHRGSDVPLLWFGIYGKPEIRDLSLTGEPWFVGQWKPSVTRAEYSAAIDAVREHIARGDTYQVNYTFRLNAAFTGDPWSMFRDLAASQQAEYSAYTDTGRFAVCSASPELFFQLSDGRITSRPMKGTAARGLTTAEDREQAAWLAASEKNRAENVMIVDMIRNDLGRVAEIGSVRVPQLFSIERYPTVLQMTSTVVADTSASPGEILAAVFPCASITGAPKAETMCIITELETTPRGVYTGAIGYIGPGRHMRFNVAIRTAVVDRETATVEYGVGGGITWDSAADDEYEECVMKSRVLTERRPEFSLLESLLWTPDDGYALLDFHIDRLTDSAEYFGYPVNADEVRRELLTFTQSLRTFAQLLPAQRHKVRLLISADGTITVEGAEIGETPQKPLRVAPAAEPVSSFDRFLYHKTTNRSTYEKALASFPDCGDVILWNERGEVTESTRANVVVDFGGVLCTPPVSSGLLAGTYRRMLLDEGRITERVITKEELAEADAVYLVNSVRGWMPVELVDEKRHNTT